MEKEPISYKIKTIHNLLKKYYFLKFGTKPDKMTIMQKWIIHYVYDQNQLGINVFSKDISKEFSINRSTTSEILKLMEQHQYIQLKSVNYDARLKEIVLLEKSIQSHLKEENKFKVIHQELSKSIDENDLLIFYKVCDQIIENINKGVR